MGVFGTKPVATKPAGNSFAGKKSAPKGDKPKQSPSLLLKVKGPNDTKSEFLTGLFVDLQGQPESGQKLSGKDKEGNRFIVFINEDNSGSLSVIPPGAKEAVRLTGLFFNEGTEYGPYHSGKDKDGNRFYVSKKKEA